MIDKKMLDRVKELSQYRLVDERPAGGDELIWNGAEHIKEEEPGFLNEL